MLRSADEKEQEVFIFPEIVGGCSDEWERELRKESWGEWWC